MESETKSTRRTSYKRTLFEECGFEGSEAEGFIYFNIGAPEPECLANVKRITMESMQALQASSGSENGQFLQYGSSQGDPEFRDELVDFLAKYDQAPESSENLCVTSGATGGLHLIASLYFKSGTPIFVEDPSYFAALTILQQDLNMNLIPVSMDSNGMDVKLLEKLLVSHNVKENPMKNPVYSAMVYTVPVYHNPTGILFSPDRCQRLVELAQEHNLLVLSDDVYTQLHYNKSKPIPKKLIAYDKSADPNYKGHVVSNGTFSKILAPGLRVGWIEANTRITKKISESGVIVSGGSMNQLGSVLVREALKLGLVHDHVQTLNNKYQERMLVACNILKEGLPAGSTVDTPEGGYFIWVVLPEYCDAEEILKFAKNKKVSFMPGNSFSTVGSFRNCLRLSIAFYTTKQVVQGVHKLCEAIQEYVSMKQEK